MTGAMGILLNGWFFNSQELSTHIEGDAILDAKSSLRDQGEPYWDDEKNQPLGKLKRAYESLAANDEVNDWCHNSFVWNSLINKHYSADDYYVFPMGSIESRLAAIKLKTMLRERGKNVYIKWLPKIVEESEIFSDNLLQVHAKLTWDWAQGRTERIALNLAACNNDFKRAYRWVAKLAERISDEVELFAWDEDLVYSKPILLLDFDYIFGDTSFLHSYRISIEPQDRDTRRIFLDRKKRLDDLLNSPHAYKLPVVLEAWLDRHKKEEDEQRSSGYDRPRMRIPHAGDRW